MQIIMSECKGCVNKPLETTSKSISILSHINFKQLTDLKYHTYGKILPHITTKYVILSKIYIVLPIFKLL